MKVLSNLFLVLLFILTWLMIAVFWLAMFLAPIAIVVYVVLWIFGWRA